VLLAVVALMVAALGITNTMLMSVLERTHEIGVMKAVGARQGELMLMFLVEGLVIGVGGRAGGLAAAWLLSFPGDALARHLMSAGCRCGWTSRCSSSRPGWRWARRCWCAPLTTLAAVMPARRAARIDPIEALRQR